MNVLIAVSLVGIIISPNPQSSPHASSLQQESYSGVSVNDIVPSVVVNPVGSSSVADDAASRAEKWLRKQRDDAAFYSPPRSGRFSGSGPSNAYRGATIVLPLSAQARGGGHSKPPCVPEVSTTLTLAAGGLGLFYTRRRLKISRN